MTVTAAIIAALGAANGVGDALLALKLSSTLLYIAATSSIHCSHRDFGGDEQDSTFSASRRTEKCFETV